MFNNNVESKGQANIYNYFTLNLLEYDIPHRIYCFDVQICPLYLDYLRLE
jgi:hypothetical protein